MKYLFLIFSLVATICVGQGVPDSSFTPVLGIDSQLPPALANYYSRQDSLDLHRGFLFQNPSYSNVDNIGFPRLKAKYYILPAILIGYGFATMGQHGLIKSNDAFYTEIQKDYPGFRSHLDDYTRYAPLAAAYGLNLAGIKGKHDMVNMSMLFVLSSFINSTLSKNLKNIAKEQRPDNSTDDSFPSAHTSSAFSKAELLNQEYKDRSPWIGIAGYSVASATGVMRMLNNRHWFSDVVAGAGIGILSTRLAYFIYPWLQQKVAAGLNKNIALAPMYSAGSYGLSLGYNVNGKAKSNNN